MDLLPSPEQIDLVRTGAQFVADQLPLGLIRERRADPVVLPAAAWAAAAELGILGIGLPEEIGGAGLGVVEEALIFRELGRGLAPGPFLACALAARLAHAAGEPALARAILAGETAVGLAELHTDVDRVDLFDPSAAYFLVLGSDGARLVPAAAVADLESVTCLDPGTRLARGRLTRTEATVALSDGGALRRHALILTAALLVGIAEATRDLAVEHAKSRVQFGRPIGIHQAVKHACADMAVTADAALQQTLFAAICLGDGRADAEFQALAAKAVTASAAIENARHAIQIFGGMGFTDEHDAHLFLKRAHVLEAQIADRCEVLPELVGLEAAQ